MNMFDILGGGFALVRDRPRTVAIWGALYLLLCGMAMLLVWPALGEMTTFQQQALAAQTAGLAPPEPPPGFFVAIFESNLVILVVLVAIFAAAVRAVALGGEDRFGFLRFGTDELRLIGLSLLLFLIGFVAMIVLVIAMVLIALGIAAIFGAGSGASTGITILVAYVGMIVGSIWLQVRISLAGALTVLRGRVVVREAWRLTHGRFWTLFGVYFVIGFAFFAITFSLIATFNPQMMSAYAMGMQPQAMEAALARQADLYADMFGPRMILMILVGAVLNTVLVAIAFGAVATATIGFDRDSNSAGTANP